MASARQLSSSPARAVRASPGTSRVPRWALRAAAAELECDQVSERTSATMQLKIVQGQHVGRPPYGWRMGANGWEHHPDEWLVVEAVAECRRCGSTYATIAKKLNMPETRARRAYKAWSWKPELKHESEVVA